MVEVEVPIIPLVAVVAFRPIPESPRSGVLAFEPGSEDRDARPRHLCQPEASDRP